MNEELPIRILPSRIKKIESSILMLTENQTKMMDLIINTQTMFKFLLDKQLLQENK